MSEILKAKADILKTLSNPIRLQIVEILLDGKKSVNEIVLLTCSSQPTISKHLSVLKSSNIISDKKEGLQVFYTLNLCCIGSFLYCLDSMLKESVENRLCTMKKLS